MNFYYIFLIYKPFIYKIVAIYTSFVIFFLLINYIFILFLLNKVIKIKLKAFIFLPF